MTRGIRAGLAMALALAALMPVTAAAEISGGDNGQGTVQIGPQTSGPVVTQGVAGYNAGGIQASAGSQPVASSGGTVSGGSGGDYSWRPVPYNQVPIVGPPQVNNQGVVSQQSGPGSQSPCPGDQVGYYVYDSQGNSLGLVCVPGPSGNFPPATSPELALAEKASSQQPWPSLTMGVNPTTGLTGLPTWYWLAGGNTNIPDATASAGSLTVSVRARLAGVTWEFGDGIAADSPDIGQPYPAQSDVQHIFQTDTFGRSGYLTQAVLRYLVTYSVNGGPWLTLGVKTTAFSRLYPVNQLQPEAVGGAQ
jgi:hypothetical protein